MQFDNMPTVDVGDLEMTLRAGTPPVQDGRYGETANKAVSTAEIFVDRWQRSMVAMRDESEKFQYPNRCCMTLRLNINSQVETFFCRS
jgi:hypothetical protein